MGQAALLSVISLFRSGLKQRVWVRLFWGRVAKLSFSLVFLLSGLSFAATRNGESTAQESQVVCEGNLQSASAAARTTRRRVAKAAAEEPAPAPARRLFTLRSFFEENPENNLAFLHPATLMTAAQKYALVLNVRPPMQTRDPLYRIRPITIYPAFTGQLDHDHDKQIIGQYQALRELSDFIMRLARGDRGGKMLLLVGPAGTGKTETLHVLDASRTELSNLDPNFMEYTYQWVDLSDVDELKPLKSTITDMKRSPFTLLREDMQREVIARVNPKVEALLGFPLRAWTQPDPKTESILEAIFRHYYPEIANGEKDIADLTRDEYLAAVERHVRIIRRRRDPKQPAAIVRAMPENPNFSLLFIAQSLRTMMAYAENDPLAYNFAGKVLQQDGGGLLLDEFFRNALELLDTYLELAQNGVLETDTGPAVEMDVVPVLTSNDESLEKAKQNGAMKAMLDRMHRVPMRLNLHPHEIEKTALLMVGKDRFKMRGLFAEEGDESVRTAANPIVPIDLNEVFPLPDEGGHLVGAYGRYALYYDYDRESQILISPHSLEFLGMAVAATRLVTDPQKMAPFLNELQVLSPQSAYYTSVKARLDVIMGNSNPEDAVRDDLYKLMGLLREGEQGISSRDIQSWISRALALAKERGRGVLTPSIIDASFNQLLEQGTLSPAGNDIRARWLDRMAIVKTEFILPALYRDIRSIVSGDGEKAERLYDDIEAELVTLAEDPDAQIWTPDNGAAPKPINRQRLTKIKAIFKKLHNREFSEGFLYRHLHGVSRGANRSRNAELLDAIRAYLVDADTDTAETATKIALYYQGKNTDPKVMRAAREAEARLEAHGYDQASFVEAIMYWQTLVYEQKMRSGERPNP